MSSVEDLRRKHILTLEALQKLSDENAALKVKLGHGGDGTSNEVEVDDEGREVHKGGGDKAVNELLMAKRNECQALEARVEDLEKNVKELSNDLKTSTSKYNEERGIAHRLKRDIETQGALLSELRRQIDEVEQGKEEDEKQTKEEKDGTDARTASLTSQVSTLQCENSNLTRELSSLRSSALSDRVSSSDLNSLNSKLVETTSSLDRLKAENEALQTEVARISSENVNFTKTNKDFTKQIDELNASLESSNRDVSEKASRISELESLLSASSLTIESLRSSLLSSSTSSPTPPRSSLPSRGHKDFGAFVALKKENASLKNQLQQLQLNMRNRVRR
ncbi:hypothetical protein TrST_g3694 [Triparma strigata]|uniref:Uncharacterized protein n=1 Tax=Triparma strigata TaxID=1606541 RepID=A0A9W7DSQ0_9STRA|nr:hypothetical protein TrST_g3694 [Triparma strigata]